jgi:hypothetical protein
VYENRNGSFMVPTRVICPTCNGRGVTEETKPEFGWVPVPGKKPQWRTLKQGSGCFTCLGVGFVAAPRTH